MLELYSYDNNKLVINDSFAELWSVMKLRGKYIQLPDQIEEINQSIPNKIIIEGKLHKDKKFHFNNNLNDIIINNYNDEIQLSVDYDYEIEWTINSNCKNKTKIGFYSPYRKFSSNHLYLNFDKNRKKLTKYKIHTGKILINCHILVVAADKYHPNISIQLTINPIIRNINKSLYHQIEYCNVKIFDIEKEGIFYRPVIKKEFKKLYSLVRKHYEVTSIKRSNNLYESTNLKLPKEIDYLGMLTKMSYDSIFTLTSNIKPITDRIGYYGIVIKRDPNVISSATIYYEFELSNIHKTDDVIVMAAYYQPNEGYVLHQIYDKSQQKYVYVKFIHNQGPYNNENNYIKGTLDLESTAVDITLIITNSLYGLLPINGKNPNTIVQFKKFEIQYNNIER